MRTFLSFYLFPFLLFSELNIVFIHIGKNIPDYVPIALKQARLFNPKSPLYFLANKEALEEFSDFAEDIKIVPLESLERSTAHEYFRTNSRHDKAMEGFWIYTSERFFYIEELACKYGLENIFHLENDMMLYRNLEEILPVFQKYYPSIGATFDVDHRVIPGFVFFRNAKSLSDLAQYLSKYGLNQNDMISLASYKKSQSEGIDFLPVIFPKYVEQYPLANFKGNTAQNPSNYWNHFNKFNSIFDAAAIGQYLGGISPRNTLKITPGFINKMCLFNVSNMKYIWIEDEQQRRIPYIEFDHQLIRINNLHIHSKRLEDFSS